MSTIVTRSGKGSPLTNAEVDSNFTNLNTDKAELSGATFTGEITANGGIALGDGDKATFGASDDLQIYHSGTGSYITDSGTGALYIQGQNLLLQNNDGSKVYFSGIGDVSTLYHGTGTKLATTSTGIDVTGTATMDGLTTDDDVSGTSTLGRYSSGFAYSLVRPSSSATGIEIRTHAGNALAHFLNDGTTKLHHNGAEKLATTATGTTTVGTANATNMQVSNGGKYIFGGENTRITGETDGSGKIRLFTGGTEKVILDGANVGIGTSLPSTKLAVSGGYISQTDGTRTMYLGSDGVGGLFGTTTDHYLRFITNNTERARISSSGAATFAGNVAANSITLADDKELILGSGSDWKIYHSGNVNYIKTNSDLPLQFIDAGGSQMMSFTPNTGLVINEAGEDFDFRVESDGNANMLFVDGENNRVGIGTGVPSGKLDVELGTTGIIAEFRGADSDILQVNSEDDLIALDVRNTSNGLDFQMQGASKMRLTQAGNLLAGTTSATPWTNGTGTSADNGIALREDGILGVSAYKSTAGAGNVAYINRTNSDGGILAFSKDGTTVGSIGSLLGVVTEIVLDPRTNGASLTGGTNKISPGNQSGALDAHLDLGSSGHRFKDLYLSSGVYLGGTGAANKLDDYEEGTWTPNLLSGTSITYTTTPTGSYTKIGKIVHISASIDVSNSNTADGSGLTIGGLPFSAVGDAMTFTLGRYRSFLAPKDSVVFGALASSTFIQLFESNNNFILYSEIGSSGLLTFSGTYTAA